MASLTGSTIAASYEQLLSLPDGGLNGNTLVAVTDGDSSTAIGMKVATSKIEVIPASDDANAFEVSNAAGTAVLTVNTSTVGATLIGALTVGVDGTGHDVIFYGNSASSNMTWDTSGDDLILNDATLNIDQDDNVAGIYIDSEATSGIPFQIDSPATTTVNVLTVNACNALTDGGVAYFHSASPNTNTRNVVDIHNDNALATGATALKLTQDAAAYTLSIDQNANASSILIDSEATTAHLIEINAPTNTSGNIISIDNANALTTGAGLSVESGGTALATTAGGGLVQITHTGNTGSNVNNLLLITNDHASSTDTTVLKIQQDAAHRAVFIDQNANGTGMEINTVGTSTNAIGIDADFLISGAILNLSSDSDSGSARNLVTITNNHVSGDAAIPLKINQDSAGQCLSIVANLATYAQSMVFLNAVGRSANSGFNFLSCYTDGDDDYQHNLTGNGVTQNSSGTFEAADYAEYFESKDGKVIAVGTTVKLDGDKIVACEDGDNPLGVIRPLNTSLVGNSAWANWGSKYLTDDYGSPIMEEYSVTEWMEDTDEVKTEEVKAQDGVEAKDAVLYKEGDELPEGKKVGDEKEAAVAGKEAVEAEAVVYVHEDFQYQTDKIPSDVTVPDDATVKSTEYDGTKLMRKKLNPDYDESKAYVEREKRDEWHIVGLLGQIPITKGQPVADSWIKIKDVSDSVEMYFVK